MQNFRATGTRVNVEKIECKELDKIFYYKDSQDKEWYAIIPDTESLRSLFNQLLINPGLDTMIHVFPYQPLMVDKETGLLIPIPTIKGATPISRFTNCFHVLYHYREDYYKGAVTQ